MKFKTKKVGEIKNYNSFGGIFGGGFKIKNIIRFFFVIGCLVLVIYFGRYLVNAARTTVNTIGKGTVNIVSEALGKEMKKDQFGNINILLVGYGGKKHSGGMLADSIMVASRNPNLGAITLVSIPRDLYINLKGFKSGKINEVFAVAYRYNENNLDEAGKIFGEKLNDILGLEIPYYALVDFDGFEKVIDTLGGLKIFIPEDIYDNAYPDDEKKIYTTFYLTGGRQTLDGETTLKYARSRHSTSDFDRSSRQQQIIKAIMDQIKSEGVIKNIGKIQELYKNYTEMVDTNISVDEIIGMMKYAQNIDNIFQFVLTTHYSERDRERSNAGGFLYTPSLEAFGGASVILPNGGSPSKVSFYDYIKNFVFYVSHNQEYLIENPRIGIYNAIDQEYSKKITKKKSEGIASKIAVKLKKYAFNITDVQNSEGTSSGTIVIIKNPGDYQETIETLKGFINISEIIAIGSGFTDTGVDMKLIIGNQYIDDTIGKTFNYNM